MDLEQVNAVVAQLRDCEYLRVGDQTMTIIDAEALRQLQVLLSLTDDMRHGRRCR